VTRLRRRELVAAAAAAVVARPSAAAAAAPDEAELLLRLIALEEAAAFARGRGGAAADERDHAKALRTLLDALGRQAPPGPTSAEELDGPARRLADAGPRQRAAAAAALESSLISEYEAALLKLRETSILRTAGTILASHSQHRVRARIAAGMEPLA
jgi:hypothetical protein